MLNFANLSDLEFEYLCKDVMSVMLKVPLERFGPGRDDGVDLTDHAWQKNIVVQVKHYIATDVRGLIASLKKEVPKVQALHPKQYYICCPKELTVNNKKEIYLLFQDYMDSSANIITLTELNDFLEQEENAEILRRHFKLWLESTNILTTILTNDICIDSEAMLYDIQSRANLFVQTRAYDQALECLQKNNVLIIIGAPGVGKTITSQMLVLYYAVQRYRVRYTTDGADLAGLKKALSQSRETKEVILLDDCFGQAYFSMKETQENELLSLIRHIKMNPNKVLIMNSRVTIYREAQERTPALVNSLDRKEYKAYVIDMSQISDVEKARIFYHHLYFGEVPAPYRAEIRKNKRYLQIVRHKNYNPRIVEFVCSRQQLESSKPDQYFDFIMQCLDYPEQIWKNEYEQRLAASDRMLLMTLYSLTNTTVSAEHLKRCYEYRISRIPEIDHSINHFRRAVARLQESMIQIIDQRGKKMISVVNPSVNDFLASYLENNEPDKQELLKNAINVSQLYRLMSKEQREATLHQLFSNGEILNYVFEDKKAQMDFIAGYCAEHQIMDIRYQPFLISYVRSMHDIITPGGLRLYERMMTTWIFEPKMRTFYGLDQMVRDLSELQEILDNHELDDMVILLLKIDDLFTGAARGSYIRIARQALKESAEFYCSDVSAANYDIDVASVVADHSEYGPYEDYIDGDGAAFEIKNIVEDQVKDELYDILAKLPADLEDSSFIETLDIDVSGSDDLVESYLSDVPEDYYEEYRNREENNREIEYIFER